MTTARDRAPRVAFLAPNAVRVTHAPAGGELPPDRPWLNQVLLPQPPVEPSAAELRVIARDGALRVIARDGACVLTETCPPQVTGDGPLALAFALEAGEALYGGGEWFNAFRRTHGRVRLVAQESQAYIQWRQTYSGLPFFILSRGCGLLLLNSHISTWRISQRRRMLYVHAEGPPADYVLIYGPSFKRIIGTYTALTGRPPLPPRWAFGLWVTGYPQEPQATVIERALEHRRRSIPLDGMILDYHWEAGFHTFRWRRELFPDPERLIAQLRELGVRLGLIFTPFLNRRNHLLQRAVLNRIFQNVSPGCERADERALAAYDEARRHGYLAHENAWWWHGSGGMVDFTNPHAARWWNERLRPLYEAGVSVFKNDDGEYLPFDARSSIGISGREYHNLYGFFYGRAIYEGMAALDERRPLIYARSVWVGSQRYPAMFLGDQHPSYRHLRSTLRAGLNMGLAGFAYWTADVFGLDGPTTPETHMRYAQWALLSPIARYFWRPPAIDATRFPWSHGPRAEANFRTYTQLRYRLLPYLYELAWEAYTSGLPLIRPMMLEFQDDTRFAGTYDQVMLGARLLVAPVTRPGARQRRILLPAGTWHDLWSNRSYQGGDTIMSPAPLDRLPILVRGGSIVPLGPPLQSIPDDHQFDQVELHCWPPFPAACTLYDDDGRTRAYQRGEYSVTHITVAGDAQTVLVRIGAAEGVYQHPHHERSVTIVVHRCSTPAAVLVGGRRHTTWSYARDASSLRIEVRCAIRHETEIEVRWKATGSPVSDECIDSG